MLNNLCVLFSCVMVAYVVFRAVQLNRQLPWFGDREPGDRDRQVRR